MSVSENNPNIIQKPTREKVFVAWDIEAGGNGFEHPVVAIGVCYGTRTSYQKRRWCLQHDVKDFELRCYQDIFDNKLSNELHV
jgi:hypothetical protein